MMGSKNRIKKAHLNTREGKLLLERLLGIMSDQELADSDVLDLKPWLEETVGHSGIPAYERLGLLVDVAISSYGPYCYWDKKKVLDEAIMEMLPRAESRRIMDARRAAQEAEDEAKD